MRLILPTGHAVILGLLFMASAAAPGKAAAPATTAPAAPAASAPAGPADKAWQQLQESAQPPHPPEAWQTAQPSEQEIEKFKAAEGERMIKAASLAKDFHTRFPTDARAEQARSKESEVLQIALQMGNTNGLARIEAIDEAKLKDPKLTEEERFEIRAGAVNRRAMSKMSQGMDVALGEFETGARALLKEFPNKGEVYRMLLAVASEAQPDKARKVAKEIVDSTAAPDQVKEQAKGILKKMESVGKPVPIKFTAVDGRAVDLEKLKGKVVLVDFWATWCGPCVKEVPNVVATYQKLHPKGFEIVGISFDQDKAKLQKFVQDQKMPWAQYFDGKQWENDYGKKFGIQSIPTMWLVDKKGNLRDLNGREDLAGKVEKLLAEN